MSETEMIEEESGEDEPDDIKAEITWADEVATGTYTQEEVCFDAVAEFIQRRHGVVLCVDRFAYAANFFFFAIPVRRSREAGQISRLCKNG